MARLNNLHFNVAFRNSVGGLAASLTLSGAGAQRAQGFMLSTEKSLTDIAAECGLADQARSLNLAVSHDSRAVSPAAWRRARANPIS